MAQPQGNPCRVEWWDTLAGKPLAVEEREARGGGLPLDAPPFKVDLACRIAAKRR
jgi:hypothetical protein